MVGQLLCAFASQRAIHELQRLGSRRGDSALAAADKVFRPIKEHHAGNQLAALHSEIDAATRRIASLERDKQALENELAEIKRTAANVLSINDQNKELRDQLATTEIQVDTLEQQNRELTGQTTRYWFMSGALVLVIGMILGLWLPRIRWQRRSRYDRF